MGEQAEHLGITTLVPFLEPLGCPLMQARSLVGEQRPVGRLLDERMAESVLRLRPAPAPAEQAEPLEFVERVARNVAEHPLEERERKRAAERRGGRDEVARGGREPIEAREDRLFHRRRYLHLHLVVEAPAVVDA